MNAQSDWRLNAGRALRDLVTQKLDPQPRSMALFGSFVRNELHAASDLDILVVGDLIPKRPSERSDWFYPVIKGYRALAKRNGWITAAAPLFLTSQGFVDSIGLRLSLCQEAWVLLDDGFLSLRFQESRSWIEGGTYRKKELKAGGFAWIPRGVSA